MTTPDLVFQAYKKQKLHPENLGHAHRKVSTFKILTSHFLDFSVIYVATSFCYNLFQNAFEQMMMTKSLQKAWLFSDHRPEFFITFPTIMMSYFFFSYFFNNGQTVGMKYTKTRYVLKEHSFRESLQATIFSVGLYFTGGLALRSLQKSISAHDYLYQQMMVWRDEAKVDLVQLTDEMAQEEELFAEAA
jgi:hypothetical protein